MPDLHELRYPIGELRLPRDPLSEQERRMAVERIAQTPVRLRAAVQGLDDKQLDTEYRPSGWTVRQVVHHLPDSHVNSYVRLKIALTEDHPTIRTYDEKLWAELPDARAPIGMSLDLLDAVHTRFVYLWRQLEPTQWDRQFHHPEMGVMRVDALAAMYAWHGDHHVAHITSLRDRLKW